MSFGKKPGHILHKKVTTTGCSSQSRVLGILDASDRESKSRRKAVLEEVFLECFCNGAGAGMNVELNVDVLLVGIDGVVTDK